MEFIQICLDLAVDFLQETIKDFTIDNFWVLPSFMFTLYYCVVIPIWGFLHIKN